MKQKKMRKTPYLGIGALDRYAKGIIQNWRISFIELVSNAWDACATEVKFSLQDSTIQIEDNGMGMNPDEFEIRWLSIPYDRIKNDQPNIVDFPENGVERRRVHGKYGIGRNSIFALSNTYSITIVQNSEGYRYKIIKNETSFEIEGDAEYIPNFRFKHGCIIEFKSQKQLLPPTQREVIKVLGSKFLADPQFEITINGELVYNFILSNAEKDKIQTPLGEIELNFIDSKIISKTTEYSGIIWWVNKKAVGEMSWYYYPKGEKEDGRYRGKKEYCFVIIADILEDYVEEDWSGFNLTKEVVTSLEIVVEKIRKKLENLNAETYRETRKRYYLKYIKMIRELPPKSKNKISQFFERLLIECPSIRDNDLDKLIKILINLEVSEYGYGLLDELSALKSEELDKLKVILENWTIQETEVILSELERRLKVIYKLNKFTNEKSDELHDLQPLFNTGLWMFGIEYDGVQYSSNQAILTFIHDKLKKDLPPDKELKKRPDFIILLNNSIGFYSAEDFDKEKNTFIIKKVVIVDLKKGKFSLTMKEIDQVRDYALILIEKGIVERNTEIIGYVLGWTNENAKYLETGDFKNIKIYPLRYSEIIIDAEKRTHNLINKINALGKVKLKDRALSETLKQESLDQQMYPPETKI